ncbi:MAG: PAS domain-containing protein [Gammaproteobacteria bacterium]|nr:PAS domain-containing protein [Gammaproteobacteria bacterium]
MSAPTGDGRATQPADEVGPGRESPLAVVGIGASAGGLDAYTQLFRHLPADTGMAFVLIQHLDPQHVSHLVELLGSVSATPVHLAADHDRLRPDHVYVIPPDAYLGVEGEELRLSPRGDTAGPFLPVDHFLRTLADSYRERAIAVILSGTGSDGTLGVQAVKGAGGVAFAQDGSAHFDSMPRAAEASGCVDFVLAPHDIAETLERIARHPHLLRQGMGETGAADQQEAAALDELFELLAAGGQVDFADYKRSTVLRRIQRRMLINHVETLAQYLALLRGRADELVALQGDLLIHVTRFFRDPGVFDALQAKVFPALLAERAGDQPLRVWVPGCATGEEVYSLAMALLDFLADRPLSPPIKLFGTDISESALEKARAGRYGRDIEADVSRARLQRYFVASEGGYQVSAALRDLCMFARHDITSDPPFSNVDLLSCRNVLIYLGSTLQRRVIPIFHFALANNGFLLLGEAETPGLMQDLFEQVDGRQKIYQRRPVPSRPLAVYPPGTARTGGKQLPYRLTYGDSAAMELQRETDRLVLARYAPPSVVVDDHYDIVLSRGDTAPFLALPGGAVSLNLMKMARPGLLMNLHALLDEARESGQPVKRDGLHMLDDSSFRDLTLQVIPLRVDRQRYYVLLFDEAPVPPAPEAPPGPPASPDSDARLTRLRHEMATTREHMQAVIDQLLHKNSELQAANEKISASLEEVHSVNEELQATEEELTTLNEELRSRNQESLRLADDLHNVLNSVEIPIVMLDAQLRLRRYTEAAVAHFGLHAEMVGHPLEEWAGQDSDSRFAALATAQLDEGAGSGTREEMQDANGRWFEYAFRPYRASEDGIQGVLITAQDIHQHKTGELIATEARKAAEKIILALDVPLVVLDTELRVQTANDAFFRLFDLTRAETTGRPLKALKGFPAITPALNVSLQGVLRDDEAFADLELRHACDDGTLRVFLCRGKRLPLPESGPVQVLLTIEDVTTRRQLEQNYLQAQKLEAIGQLAAGVAHDFNNQLMVIGGYAALLRGQAEHHPQMREALGRIIEASDMATSIARQLLMFSRKADVRPETIDLARTVGDLATMLRTALGASITLDLELPAGLWPCIADPVLVAQSVLNLCVNARDAMPAGGQLRIAARNLGAGDPLLREQPDLEPERFVALVLRDTGEGMNEATLARAFEPFYTTKGVGKGTGLGLASVYGAMTQGGGRVLVKSRVGEGTEFTLLFPRASAAGTAAH